VDRKKSFPKKYPFPFFLFILSSDPELPLCVFLNCPLFLSSLVPLVALGWEEVSVKLPSGCSRPPKNVMVDLPQSGVFNPFPPVFPASFVFPVRSYASALFSLPTVSFFPVATPPRLCGAHSSSASLLSLPLPPPFSFLRRAYNKNSAPGALWNEGRPSLPFPPLIKALRFSA